MAFLRPSFVEEASAFIRGEGLWLRPPAMSDYDQWAYVRRISRDHLVPFEPQWAMDELSRAAYRERIRLYQRERELIAQQMQRLIDSLHVEGYVLDLQTMTYRPAVSDGPEAATAQ